MQIFEIIITVVAYLVTMNVCILIGREFGSFEKFILTCFKMIRDQNKL